MLSPELLLCVVLLLGLLIGSFLNVCIFRIPVSQDLFDEETYPMLAKLRAAYAVKQQMLSVSFPPRSFCPSCNHELCWYHNIPVVSWLCLRGRCAFCQAPIGVRYPLVELSSALAAVMSVYLFDYSWAALACYILVACFIVISCIDYDHYMIPDVITYPLVALGVLVSFLNGIYSLLPPPFVYNSTESLLGFLMGAGVLYTIAKGYLWLRKREGLGLGDVKLLAVTGVWFGYQGSFFTIFVGSLLGSIGGVLFMIARRSAASQEIPFGPYLCIANILYIIQGSQRGQLLIEALLQRLGW
jgi:leader peptidase (prepilin peptidase)/N-methyltransferase